MKTTLEILGWDCVPDLVIAGTRSPWVKADHPALAAGLGLGELAGGDYRGLAGGGRGAGGGAGRGGAGS